MEQNSMFFEFSTPPVCLAGFLYNVLQQNWLSYGPETANDFLLFPPRILYHQYNSNARLPVQCHAMLNPKRNVIELSLLCT